MRGISRIVLTALLATMVIGTTPSSGDDRESQELQGTWNEVFALRGGKHDGEAQWSDTLVIQGDKFDAKHGKPVHGEIVVDAKKELGTIDLIYGNGPLSGRKLKGIYKLSGPDVLIINLGLRDWDDEFNKFDPRPENFNSGPKSWLLIFIRVKK